jgi:hypothetical protein
MLEKVLKIISEVMEAKFTGCVEIHFFSGTPSKIKYIHEDKI